MAIAEIIEFITETFGRIGWLYSVVKNLFMSLMDTMGWNPVDVLFPLLFFMLILFFFYTKISWLGSIKWFIIIFLGAMLLSALMFLLWSKSQWI